MSMMSTERVGPKGWPEKQGLYDPQFEHDSCGVGFVVNIKGKKSHKIIRDALTVLINLNHRGACGCEANTGDGAGILMQMPHGFFKEVARKDKIKLPPLGDYGVAMVFLPRDPNERRTCETMFENIVVEEGQKFLGWRIVPTDNATLGATARASEPFVQQAFIRRNAKLADDMAFERKLYVIRKRAERAIRYSGVKGGHWFYISSLSCRTLVYKGMLLTEQMDQFYPDLKNPAMESALALVHSRFSTNTFPSWERAHPYRYIAHNGEINTLRGNINWMHARQAMFQSDLFGDDIKKMLPIINTDGSDSAMFDNCLELLVLAGRSLPHAIMMMIPEPWANHATMSDEKKAFYEYHSCLMEPWDGPASIAFTDGKKIGAVLDRNGLRPSRYYVTKDDLVIMASEVGVLDVPPDRILQKGRLQPGRMFLVDTEEGPHRGRRGDQAQDRHRAALPPMAQRAPAGFGQRAAKSPHAPEPSHDTVLQRQQAFGYTFEDLRIVMAPMARDGVEAVGSMGSDTPLAVLSDKPQLLYNYFKQLFAQVTNPPIDCIREELVTSAATTIGSERNLLKPKPTSCNLIKLKSPILTNEEFAKLKYINQAGFKSVTLPILFKAGDGEAGLAKAMEDLCARASSAVEAGANILILSDRGVDRGTGAHPRAAGGGRVASSSDPRRHAHAGRPGPRIRRAARSASFLAADRLRRRRDQSLLAFETLDDMIRQGLLVEHHAQGRLQELRQGRGQGRGQGHVQDGHLHHPELSRRADFRGHRPASVGHRQILHRDRLARRRHRAGCHRARSANRAISTPFPTARSTATPWTSAAIINGAPTASITCSIRRPSTSCRHACRNADYKAFKEYSPAGQRPVQESLHPARLARIETRLPSPFPSRRSSRSKPSSSGSSPARCPTARSARRRTRRWPSP